MGKDSGSGEGQWKDWVDGGRIVQLRNVDLGRMEGREVATRGILGGGKVDVEQGMTERMWSGMRDRWR